MNIVENQVARFWIKKCSMREHWSNSQYSLLLCDTSWFCLSIPYILTEIQEIMSCISVITQKCLFIVSWQDITDILFPLPFKVILIGL